MKNIKEFLKGLKQTNFFRNTIILVSVFLLLPGIVFSQTTDEIFVDGFDFPVGKTEGDGYYNAQGIGIWNQKFRNYHLGEDWNKKCGSDCDLGDPVYAIANGKVVFKSYEKTWGNIIILRHQLTDNTQVDSMYAHLKDNLVSLNQIVPRGYQIGTIGKGDSNIFPAHLHFEIRNDTTLGKGIGYGPLSHPGYLNPSEFIRGHRPLRALTLAAENKQGEGIRLSWSKPDFEIDKIEIYRATEQNGTQDTTKRSTVATLTTSDTLEHVDKTSEIGRTYFYGLGIYGKNGLFVQTNEVSSMRPNEIIRIETTPAQQSEPVIASGKVFWTDSMSSDPGKYNIYCYDLAEKKTCSYPISLPKTGSASEIDAGGKHVIFQSNVYGQKSNVYAINIEDSSIQMVNPDESKTKDQITPSVSENGIAVWADDRNGTDYDIFIRNLTGGEESLFAGGVGNQRYPEISGSNVVWIDSRAGNRHDLYVKDINGGGEILIDTNVGLAEPDIWQNYVVWPKDKTLKIYNISTKVTQSIPGAATYFHVARIDDGKIAHLESGKRLVYIYDIATQKHKIIDVGDLIPKSAYVFGNILVFAASKTGTSNDDIYLTWF